MTIRGPSGNFLPGNGQDFPDCGDGLVQAPQVDGTGILGEQKVNGRWPMINNRESERLEMRWLPVVDASGRTRMEATWVPVGAAAPQSAVSHAA
jgi:hypothetical protein